MNATIHTVLTAMTCWQLRNEGQGVGHALLHAYFSPHEAYVEVRVLSTGRECTASKIASVSIGAGLVLDEDNSRRD